MTWQGRRPRESGVGSWHIRKLELTLGWGSERGGEWWKPEKSQMESLGQKPSDSTLPQCESQEQPRCPQQEEVWLEPGLPIELLVTRKRPLTPRSEDYACLDSPCYPKQELGQEQRGQYSGP